MSTFALLSRSAKLRKQNGAGLSNSSAGQEPKPPISIRDHAIPPNSSSRFQGIGERVSPADHSTSLANPKSSTVYPIEQSNGDRLSTEASKQILKTHKLKITQLWGSENLERAKSSSKKRKRAAEATSGDSKKKRKVEIVPQPLTDFGNLRTSYQLPQSLLMNLNGQGYRVPTEVQIGSLPLLLDGSSYAKPHQKPTTTIPACNLMTVAPTGSGKTLAFLIPMLASILHNRNSNESRDSAHPGPLAVILAPTKELARQIVNESRKLAARTGIRTTLVRKGVSLSGGSSPDSSDSDGAPATAGKSSGVKSQILVGTPMAMIHAASAEGSQNPALPTVENLVLDEADVLLDPLFREQTMQIWDACSHPSLRVSLWSATVGSSIEELATANIASLQTRKPAGEPSPDAVPFIRLIVGLKDSSIPNIEHRLIYAATEQGKLMGLRQLLHSSSTTRGGASVRPPFLVFTQTIPRAIALHSELLYDIPPEAGGSSRIAVLHSDLSETVRDKVMTRLRKGEVWVLITTDLLARGIDFKGINGVVNYDLPTSSAVYVHRAGRTGRAGKEGGVAVTYYSKDDLPFVKNIANVIAAAERQRGSGEEAEASRKWLLDSLPKVTKKDKQRLKQRGVESRRSTGFKKADGDSRVPESRISTKGGFIRRLENKRQGAIAGAKRRATAADLDGKNDEESGDSDS